MRRRFLSALLLWLSAVVPFALASVRPELFSSWYPAWSLHAGAAISKLTGFTTVSVGELGFYALALAAVIHTVRAAIRGVRAKALGREMLRVLTVLLIWSGAMASAAVWLWSINYFMPTPSERMGMKRYAPSDELLVAAAYAMRDRLNAAAAEVPRDENKKMLPQPFSEAGQGVARGYAALSERYDFLTPDGAPVKRLTFWPVQSYTGVSGIYIPWTAECNINPDTPWPNIISTMAHEMAHRQGAAPEDQANFLGLLACRESGDACVRYGGEFVAFIYVFNALAEDGHNHGNEIFEIWSSLDEGVLADMGVVTQHYEQYEGSLNEAGEAVNDVYLKTMQQEEGVASYGLVVDLIISDLIAQGKIAE